MSKITNGLSYIVLADGNQVNLSGISDLSDVAINNHILTLEAVDQPSEKINSFGGKDTEATKANVKASGKEDLVGNAELVNRDNG